MRGVNAVQNFSSNRFITVIFASLVVNNKGVRPGSHYPRTELNLPNNGDIPHADILGLVRFPAKAKNYPADFPRSK